MIFDRYVNHEKGDGRVAEYMITHGYGKATRENGKLVYIDESFVGNVIRNEVYCGIMVYGKRKNVKNPKTGKVSTQLGDEFEWYRAEGLHEPIISKELFEKAQAIRKKNTYYQPKVYNPTHAAIFSGILVCPECGSPMHGVGGMGKVKLDALMANIISQIGNNEEFRNDMKGRLGKAVDTSEYEAQIDVLTKQIRNKTKTLKRKSMLIDEFNWEVENADTLYDALNDDYMKLRNEVISLENSLREVEDTIKSIESQQVTKDNLFRFILEFGRAYKGLSEIEKKNLANQFIEKIEIFHEERDNGSVIKSVTFRFPIKLGGKQFEKIEVNGQTSSDLVETCVLLSKLGQ